METNIVTSFTEKDFAKELEKFGIEKYRATQIFKWVYKKGVFDFAKMTDLAKDKINTLNDKFKLIDTKIFDVKISKDGTSKFLIKLSDGYCIEAVLLNDKSRYTACLSSQIGCTLGCDFCLSGKFKFQRNLMPHEMIEQLLLMKSYLPEGSQNINNIVFMGMGEPLLNYDNVLKAIDIISSKNSFNIGSRKITISTSGIIPGIERLAKEKKQLRLSVSLHSPFQKIREKIMPISSKYPLKNIISAVIKYSKETKRQVTFEYALLKGINDSTDDAKELSIILKNIPCSVNLIPYNETDKNKYLSTDIKEQYLFKEKLSSLGINVTLRTKRGQDIGAACGQLTLNTP